MSRIKPAESEVGAVEGVIQIKEQEKKGLKVRTVWLVAGALRAGPDSQASKAGA